MAEASYRRTFGDIGEYLVYGLGEAGGATACFLIGREVTGVPVEEKSTKASGISLAIAAALFLSASKVGSEQLGDILAAGSLGAGVASIAWYLDFSDYQNGGDGTDTSAIAQPAREPMGQASPRQTVEARQNGHNTAGRSKTREAENAGWGSPAIFRRESGCTTMNDGGSDQELLEDTTFCHMCGGPVYDGGGVHVQCARDMHAHSPCEYCGRRVSKPVTSRSGRAVHMQCRLEHEGR